MIQLLRDTLAFLAEMASLAILLGAIALVTLGMTDAAMIFYRV